MFLDKDTSVYRIGSSLIKNNKVIRKIKLEDITFGYVIGDKFYPSLTDLRDSPMIISEANEVLFIREYYEFGDYKLHCYTGCELDNDLLFGFSHMIKPFKDLDLHWSNSRVYSTSLKQWLSLDPMLYWNIDSFLKQPENWHGYSYCDDDPVNCVDPSGYAAFATRNLEDSPIKVTNTILDKLNIEVAHEQLFFHDTMISIGHGANGPLTVNESFKGRGYEWNNERSYNDDLMRIAVDNTPMGEYKLIGRDKNNCQDWADRVRSSYSDFENSYFIDRNSFGLDSEFNFDTDFNMSNGFDWSF